MNSFDSYKLACVCMFMQREGIDVCDLLDTLHSTVTLKAYVRILRVKLCVGTAVYGSIHKK